MLAQAPPVPGRDVRVPPRGFQAREVRLGCLALLQGRGRMRVRPNPRCLATAVLVGVFATVGGCASGGGGRGGSFDEITREQIAELSESDAYTIIQQFRSRWLRSRARVTFGSVADAGAGGDPVIYPVIFQDDIRYGSIDALRDFQSPEIERIEYINALDATTLYGTGYMGGIIRIVTRGGRRRLAGTVPRGPI